MRKSFSLIEVIIFVSILSLFLISAASIITISLQQNTLQVEKLKARHHADQLLEWIKSEKDIDWQTFLTRAGNYTYCFENEALAWGTDVASGNDCTLLNSLYKRYATFRTTGSGGSAQVDVVVTVEWMVGGSTYDTTLHTIFSQWD